MTTDNPVDVYTDFVFCRTTEDIDTSATTVTVDDVAFFPDSYDLTNVNLWMTFESDLTDPNTFEIVRVTAVDVESSTLTIERGDETGVSAHDSGTYMKGTLTSGMLRRVRSGMTNTTLPDVTDGWTDGMQFYLHTTDDHYLPYFFANGTWFPMGYIPPSYGDLFYYPGSPNGDLVIFDEVGDPDHTSPITNGALAGDTLYQIFIPSTAFTQEGQCLHITDDTDTVPGTPLAIVTSSFGSATTIAYALEITGLAKGDFVQVNSAYDNHWGIVMDNSGDFSMYFSEAPRNGINTNFTYEYIEVIMTTAATDVAITELDVAFHTVSGNFGGTPSYS